MEGGNYKVIKARPSDITKGVLDRIEKIFNDGFGKEKFKCRGKSDSYLI